jgi:hypothetical protein
MQSKKDMDLNELKALIRSVIEEDVPPLAGQNAAAKAPGAPPPLPNKAAAQGQNPASAALPKPGALNKFKADVNMAADAAMRVKQNVDSANTKEALRWLDKLIQFATSAKSQLGSK